MQRNHVLFTLQIGLNVAVSYAFSKVLAYRFGTSAEKDGFDIAFSVPMIILSVGGFGFLSYAVTTHVAKMLESDRERLSSVFSTLLTYMMTICAALLVACIFFSGQVMALLGPGLTPEVMAQMRQLLPYLLPLIISLGFSTYFAAVLAGHSLPLTIEFSLIVTRLGAIGYVLCRGRAFGLDDVALGLSAASFLALAFEWYLVRRATGIRFRVRFYAPEPEFSLIVRQMAGLLAASLVIQISQAYMRRVATLDGVGTNAMLTYVLCVISPISVVLAKPIALTQGPRIARLIAKGDRQAARAMVLRCLLISGALAVGGAWFVWLAAEPLIGLVFGGGRFDAAAVAATAEMLRYCIWALPGLVAGWVILMPMLTMRNEHVPAMVTGMGYAFHLLLTWLMFPMLGRQGIALAYTIAMNLQATLGGFLVYRELWGPKAHDGGPALEKDGIPGHSSEGRQYRTDPGTGGVPVPNLAADMQSTQSPLR